MARRCFGSSVCAFCGLLTGSRIPVLNDSGSLSYTELIHSQVNVFWGRLLSRCPLTVEGVFAKGYRGISARSDFVPKLVSLAAPMFLL